MINKKTAFGKKSLAMTRAVAAPRAAIGRASGPRADECGSCICDCDCPCGACYCEGGRPGERARTAAARSIRATIRKISTSR